MDKNELKDLSHISRIDIELQSYCNRKCEWCPNKDFLRDFHEILPRNVYVDLLYQLLDANYIFRNQINTLPRIHFIGYQEPFSNIDLLEDRINICNDILGKDNIWIHLSTNGDYLCKQYLDKIHASSIIVNDYDCNGKTYWQNKLISFGGKNISYNKLTDRLGCRTNTINNLIVQLNWKYNCELENRGGYFKQGDLSELKWKNNMDQRIIPCLQPQYYINISYDGSVMPCCHMRPDNPEHKDYILGNIKDTPLVDIYYSEKAKKIREKLRVHYGDYPEPCKYCQKI